MNQLKDYSEKYLIGEILKKQPLNPPSFVKIKDGDDAAGFSFGPGQVSLATTDPFLEDVHFSRKYLLSARRITGLAGSYEAIGKKALAINVSDILSMAGLPRLCLVSLFISGNEKKEIFDGILKGLLEAAGRYGIYLAGGDLAGSASGIGLTITLIGEVKAGGAVKRSGSEAGNYVYVTKPHGESGYGLYLLRKKSHLPKSLQAHFVRKHILPEPDFESVRYIRASGCATSMTDSSDGLYRALEILSLASGNGMDIELDSLPVSEPMRRYIPADMLDDFMLFGAEDYLPVFTAKKRLDRFYCIGRVSKQKGLRFFKDDREIKTGKKGFDHFSFKKS